MNVFQNFRQQFKGYRKQANQTYVEFAGEKEQFFDRWCHSEQINGSDDKLKQLWLLEKLKNCVSNDLKIYLSDRHVDRYIMVM